MNTEIFPKETTTDIIRIYITRVGLPFMALVKVLED